MKIDHVITERKNKIIYREGDKLIKLFNTDFSKADVLNEALNHARVELTGLFIPRLHQVTTIEGQWALVFDFIEGEPLDVLMEKNPDKLAEYLDLFVKLQMEVHAHACDQLGTLRDKMYKKILQADLDPTTRYNLHARLEGMPKHNRLCHGDFNPSNIIVTKDGLACVIDWAHATQGNASADVARTYLLFCLHGQEQIANQYLDLFCARSGTEKRYVQKWLPIVAASQSVKGNKEEREFLLHWAGVVEYV